MPSDRATLALTIFVSIALTNMGCGKDEPPPRSFKGTIPEGTPIPIPPPGTSTNPPILPPYELSWSLGAAGATASHVTYEMMESDLPAASLPSTPEFLPWHLNDTAGIGWTSTMQALREEGAVLKPVVVAVLDTGIDQDHMLLKEHIWRNPWERNGQPGVDDDGNGYVDDGSGWNYLGTSTKDQFECTRVLVRCRSGERAADPEMCQKAQRLYERMNESFRYAFRPHLFDLVFESKRKDRLLDPDDLSNGDPNAGRDPHGHGTSVSSAIAASSAAIPGSKIGMIGVHPGARIMPLTVIPDGDEHDKDVAAAIRYAASNGAKVVNMSFGKGISPQPDLVRSAMRFAAEKDVLLVLAAGNDTQDIDKFESFPSPGEDEIIRNHLLVVGATDADERSAVPARFSNYGKKGVDLFAPGTQIMSAIPGNFLLPQSGTSLAAPLVAGAAALLRSLHPHCEASEIRRAILDGTRKYPDTRFVFPIGSPETTLGEISRSGGTLWLPDALRSLRERASCAGQQVP